MARPSIEGGPTTRQEVEEKERRLEAIAKREAKSARETQEPKREIPSGGAIVGGVSDIPGIKEYRESAKEKRETQESLEAIAKREALKELAPQKAEEKLTLAKLKTGPKAPKEDLPKEAPPEFMRPEGEIATKRSKEIALVASGKPYEAEKRFAKSFVPGLLTKEDWPDLTPTEKAAYIAGDIGQAVLYVLGGVGVFRAVMAKSPVKGARGTFPKIKDVRVITKSDVKQIVKNLAKEKGVTPKELKDTVPIEKPIKAPKDTIIIVNETSAGKLEVRTAKLPYRPTESLPERPGWPKPVEPKELTKGGRTGLPPEAPKGGGAKPAPPSTATMTAEQLARQLGIDPVTIGRPVIIPIPKRGKMPKPKPLPLPKPKPKKAPKPVKPEKPAEKPSPRPTPTPSPAPSPEPSPKPQPGPEPKPSPAPEPAPEPTATPGTTPTPEPSPKPQPTPSPTPTPTPTPPPTKPPTEPPTKPPPYQFLPPFRLPKGGLSDKETREIIKSADGAIAWRMGKLRGKARWDVIVNPYTSNEHYYMVLGDPPEGATIAVGGPKSAYRTAQMLRGKPPSKEVKVDSGFQDITVTPEGKKITLHFTPDPKLETKGDITIGQGIPRISTRTRLPVSRAPRITPRMPRLR